MGNQPSCRPRKESAMSARKNGGNAPMKISSGGKVLSTSPPRRQEPATPMMLPTMKLMVSAVSPNSIVQKRPLPITAVTGVGNDENETPKSKRKACPRYVMY